MPVRSPSKRSPKWSEHRGTARPCAVCCCRRSGLLARAARRFRWRSTASSTGTAPDRSPACASAARSLRASRGRTSSRRSVSQVAARGAGLRERAARTTSTVSARRHQPPRRTHGRVLSRGSRATWHCGGREDRIVPRTASRTFCRGARGDLPGRIAVAGDVSRRRAVSWPASTRDPRTSFDRIAARAPRARRAARGAEHGESLPRARPCICATRVAGVRQNARVQRGA